MFDLDVERERKEKRHNPKDNKDPRDAFLPALHRRII